jgi:hypothetical protein
MPSLTTTVLTTAVTLTSFVTVSTGQYSPLPPPPPPPHGPSDIFKPIEGLAQCSVSAVHPSLFSHLVPHPY